MNNFSFKSLCCCCGSLLLVEKEDIRVKIGKNLNLYYTFKCPCCNIESEITSSILPYNIRVNALRNFKTFLKGEYIYEGINV